MFTICLTTAPACADPEETRLLETLLAQVARGEKTPLGQFYERTKGAIYGFVLSILKNTYDSEDVLQETYIQVYAAAETYMPRGKPMAWVLTIARNLALMKIRERKKTADIPQEDWEAFYTEAPGFSEDDRIVLEAVLQTLSGEELQIVMLHAAAGFRHREIGEFLSLPLSTVLSKYHRAMKKLRERLTEGEEK